MAYPWGPAKTWAEVKATLAKHGVSLRRVNAALTSPTGKTKPIYFFERKPAAGPTLRVTVDVPPDNAYQSILRIRSICANLQLSPTIFKGYHLG